MIRRVAILFVIIFALAANAFAIRNRLETEDLTEVENGSSARSLTRRENFDGIYETRDVPEPSEEPRRKRKRRPTRKMRRRRQKMRSSRPGQTMGGMTMGVMPMRGMSMGVKNKINKGMTMGGMATGGMTMGMEKKINKGTKSIKSNKSDKSRKSTKSEKSNKTITEKSTKKGKSEKSKGSKAIPTPTPSPSISTGTVGVRTELTLSTLVAEDDVEGAFLEAFLNISNDDLSFFLEAFTTSNDDQSVSLSNMTDPESLRLGLELEMRPTQSPVSAPEDNIIGLRRRLRFQEVLTIRLEARTLIDCSLNFCYLIFLEASGPLDDVMAISEEFLEIAENLEVKDAFESAIEVALEDILGESVSVIASAIISNEVIPDTFAPTAAPTTADPTMSPSVSAYPTGAAEPGLRPTYFPTIGPQPELSRPTERPDPTNAPTSKPTKQGFLGPQPYIRPTDPPRLTVKQFKQDVVL